MHLVQKLRSPLMYVLTLGLVLGLVGCAGAGYPVNPNASNDLGATSPASGQPGEASVPGNSAPGNLPGQASVPGNPSVSNPPVGNPPVVGNIPSNSLTPGAPYEPYPMPQPNMPPGIPYPMPQPNMPPGIIGFLPPDGLQVCPTPRVVLAVKLTDAMRSNGAFDPSKVKLTLDGQDILSQIQLIAPMMYPQSQVTLAYVQKTPLALGAHQVKFTYPGTSGPITLTWNFTVANIPCP